MTNIWKIAVILSAFLLLTGCSNIKEPKVPQYSTGMKKTNEWISYNKKAKKDNKPILDFIATSIYKPSKSKRKIINYDEFLTIDKKIYLITKWRNVKKDDLLEIRFYQPDGRLAQYNYLKYKYNTTKWRTWSNLRVKHYYNSKNEGRWKADVFINGEFVTSKYFNIGISKTVNKTVINKTLGVFPLYNSELSRWNLSYGASIYIVQGILYNNKNIAVIPNKLISRDLLSPNTNYKEFAQYIKNDLISDDSIIMEIAKKHNMDYAILGKIQSISSKTIDTEIELYIIDINNKKFVYDNKIKDIIRRSGINIGTDWSKRETIVYEKALQSILPFIKNIK